MKRRAAKLFLIVFALWPLLQFALVARYEASPWNLAGWAMYCAPSLRPAVAVFRVRAGKPERINEDSLPLPVQSEVRRYAERRRVLGRLASSDAVGRTFYEQRSDIPWTLVVVETRRLDRETALIERHLEKYVYHRGLPVDLDALRGSGDDD